FFNDWKERRYSELNLDGVYVLICRDPSYFQIGVGDETAKRAFTLSDRDRMRDVMMSAFRQKDFDTGIVQAMELAKQTFDRKMGDQRSQPPPVANAGQSGSAPPPVVVQPRTSPRAPGGGGLNCVTIGLILIGIVIVLGVLRRVLGGA